jgi:hypothetical protein
MDEMMKLAYAMQLHAMMLQLEKLAAPVNLAPRLASKLSPYSKAFRPKGVTSGFLPLPPPTTAVGRISHSLRNAQTSNASLASQLAKEKNPMSNTFRQMSDDYAAQHIGLAPIRNVDTGRLLKLRKLNPATRQLGQGQTTRLVPEPSVRRGVRDQIKERGY